MGLDDDRRGLAAVNEGGRGGSRGGVQHRLAVCTLVDVLLDDVLLDDAHLVVG